MRTTLSATTPILPPSRALPPSSFFSLSRIRALTSHAPPCPQIVLLGANDAAMPHSQPTQYCPLDEYRANLLKIVTHPHVVAHAPTILLVTPPPLDETRIHQFDVVENGLTELTRNAANSAAYSEAARSVAAEVAAGGGVDVVLVDLQRELMARALELTPDVTDADFEDGDRGKPLLGYLRGRRGALGDLVPDGLHLSAAAYRIFFDLVRPLIGPFPLNMDMKGPDPKFPNPFPSWRLLAEERGAKQQAANAN